MALVWAAVAPLHPMISRKDPHPQSVCRFALAQCTITPPIGIYHRMWGAATHDRSEGVHRPLTATAMLFAPVDSRHRPEEAFLLVALDLCVMCDAELDPLIEAIVAAVGLNPSQISVSFGHTHGVGLYSPDRVDLPGGELIPSYLQQLNRSVGNLAAECLENLEPVAIHYGSGWCGLATNRDFHDPERGIPVCGYNPDQTADGCVTVARITRSDQTLAGSVVNYACHPTSLAWENRLISPDYPGAMRELIETATDAPCVFLQGASGELGPRIGFKGDPAVADQNGRQLGYAALSALEALPTPGTDLIYTGAVASGALLGTWAERPVDPERSEQIRHWVVRDERIPIPYRADLPELATLETELAHWTRLDLGDSHEVDGSGLDPHAEAEKARRALERRHSLPAGDRYPYRVSLIRMGDSVWVSVQGEPYSLLQTELRRRFPQLTILVASISNSWSPAYLPPEDAWGDGRYQEKIAILQRGCLETVIERLTVMIEQT